MKLFFLIVILGFFVVLSILVYLKYYYRYLLYKDLVYLCKSLKNNIAFNKNTIAELIENAEKNISNFTKRIINGKIDKQKTCIVSKEDYIIIDAFIKSLGAGDIKYEINNITYYENEFNDKKVLSKELLNKDGKMYLKLIIGVGVAIFIILI